MGATKRKTVEGAKTRYEAAPGKSFPFLSLRRRIPSLCGPVCVCLWRRPESFFFMLYSPHAWCYSIQLVNEKKGGPCKGEQKGLEFHLIMRRSLPPSLPPTASGKRMNPRWDCFHSHSSLEVIQEASQGQRGNNEMGI